MAEKWREAAKEKLLPLIQVEIEARQETLKEKIKEAENLLPGFKEHLDEVRQSRRDPNSIDVPKNLQKFCGDKVKKPKWLTPQCVFSFAHYFALFVTCYAILWTGLSMHYKQVLCGLQWKPLQLFKLGYPMVPVILGCWIARHWHNHTTIIRETGLTGLRRTCGSNWRMTPGYYFANLKMSLMVSLGPGVLIGAVGKLVVLKLLGVERILGPTYSEFLLPIAWLLGCMAWYFVSDSFYRRFADKYEEAERCRKDDKGVPTWGFYVRWVVDYDASRPWKEWIRAGPHWIAGVIEAPQYGTFHRIAAADRLRCFGITLCCAVWWLLMILAGLVVRDLCEKFNELNETRPMAAMLIHTDAHNLITNTLTAPWLIYKTWRPEPKPSFAQAAIEVTVVLEQKKAQKRNENQQEFVIAEEVQYFSDNQQKWFESSVTAIDEQGNIDVNVDGAGTKRVPAREVAQRLKHTEEKKELDNDKLNELLGYFPTPRGRFPRKLHQNKDKEREQVLMQVLDGLLKSPSPSKDHPILLDELTVIHKELVEMNAGQP